MSNLVALDLDKLPTMSKEEIRDSLVALEEVMRGGEVVEEEIYHNFGFGTYAREMRIKAGWLVMGKIHKFETLNFLLEGEVYVISPTEGYQHYVAPCTVVAKPGAKRLFYALKDSTWTVVLGTHERDIDKIEAEFIAKDFSEVAV